jgi:hypothetical protein
MRLTLFFLLLINPGLFATPKAHVVTFGKWTTVKRFIGEDDSRALDAKVRTLLVDGRTKEFTIGPAHDITEHTFVVQRMFRSNDSLPQETGSPHWRWERGGWLLVDRASGKVQELPLPEFDPYYSAASWFRDYAAYCGISDDGKKLIAVIAQVGKRKPVLKKAIGDATDSDVPDSACATPVWERGPSRVTFSPQGQQRFTYTVRSRVVDLISQDEEVGEQ